MSGSIERPSEASEAKSDKRNPSWLAGKRETVERLFKRLETTEIEQFCSYEGICPQCHTVKYGILDESRMTLPLTGYIDHLLKVKLILRKVDENGIDSTYTFSEGSYIPSLLYEIRQDIVKSGCFSREQLAESHFSEHELEVNDRSFRYLRPERCDCDFGEPEYTEEELSLIALCEKDDLRDRLTGPEANFVGGRPVRTGFRRRSEAARIRRSRKTFSNTPRLIKLQTRTVVPKVHPSITGGPLAVIVQAPLELNFQYLPKKKRDGISSRNRR